ncbi:MAG: hypothetical protein Kow0068_05980 [Marinilabiliales bacterium]
MKRYFYILLIIYSLAILTSCSEYQRILKSSDYNLKYTKGVEYYQKGDYFRALSLFEELTSIYKGTSKAEKIYFYYAYCHFYQGDYILAGYHFKNFARSYPLSKNKEEAEYMAAYCYYLNSPPASLDQSYTYKAIDELQLFVNKYPYSERVSTELNIENSQAKGLIINDVYIPKQLDDIVFEINLFDYSLIKKFSKKHHIDIDNLTDKKFDKKKDIQILRNKMIENLKELQASNKIIADTASLLENYIKNKNLKDLKHFISENKLHIKINKNDTLSIVADKVIKKIRSIGKYPTCNELIDQLYDKLELKSFNNAKLYYNLREYKAAIIALKNSLKNYPDSRFREDILFLILKSSFLLAENSIEKKQEERYLQTKTEYYALMDEFPETKYKKDADNILEITEKKINKLKLN